MWVTCPFGVRDDKHDLDDDWASSFRESALQFVDVLRGRCRSDES
jgi:hypothetical protein